MDKGRRIIGEQIKADAIPLGTVVDGVVKEVWADDDYETVEEWVEYTADELAAIEEAEKRNDFIANAPAYFAALTSAFGEVE